MSHYGNGPDDFDERSRDEQEEYERWQRVEEMEREVEEDGGDPVDLYSFE